MNSIYANKIQCGFVATTAVILLATGTLAFCLATLGSAVLYADSVDKRELRIQAGLNAETCLDTVALMAVKDYFLNGPVHISEFDCDAVVWRDGAGDVLIDAAVNFNGVRSTAQYKYFQS